MKITIISSKELTERWTGPRPVEDAAADYYWFRDGDDMAAAVYDGIAAEIEQALPTADLPGAVSWNWQDGPWGEWFDEGIIG